MEKRIDLTRVRRNAAESARLLVQSARNKLERSLQLGFKTWNAMEAAVAKARENDYRRHYGRSVFYPHKGVQQLARTQRVGSQAWHAWKNEAQ